MAELIDKGALIDNLESMKKYQIDVDDAIEIIANTKATTEADIRNKAISEFAEKIRDWQKEIYTNERYVGELDFLFKHIYEIAEQLKGE